LILLNQARKRYELPEVICAYLIIEFLLHGAGMAKNWAAWVLSWVAWGKIASDKADAWVKFRINEMKAEMEAEVARIKTAKVEAAASDYKAWATANPEAAEARKITVANYNAWVIANPEAARVVGKARNAVDDAQKTSDMAKKANEKLKVDLSVHQHSFSPFGLNIKYLQLCDESEAASAFYLATLQNNVDVWRIYQKVLAKAQADAEAWAKAKREE